MNPSIGSEEAIHGRRFSEVHGGYFADPLVAGPLVDTVESAALGQRPNVIVDLGGGTGYLLTQMTSRLAGSNARLINIDCSGSQLAVSGGAGINSLALSVRDFKRCDIAGANERVLFMMRSVLHYFAEEDLLTLLAHLREQALKDEIFVHQSASFEESDDAACINALYRRMRTGKWFTTVGDMEDRLKHAGWNVRVSFPAPTLHLASNDLAVRYGLNGHDLDCIRDAMKVEFGERPGLFECSPAGFSARLHYRIYTCVAS